MTMETSLREVTGRRDQQRRMDSWRCWGTHREAELEFAEAQEEDSLTPLRRRRRTLLGYRGSIKRCYACSIQPERRSILRRSGAQMEHGFVG
jgi:hypothetical protein